MEKEKLKEIIEITPAWDKRSEDPSKNYGVHGVEIRFLVKGKHGAIQFLLFTNWFLPEVNREFKEEAFSLLYEPLPADLGYHSYKPMHNNQEPFLGKCKYLENKPCYYDGSSLRAIDVFNVLLREGDKGLWKRLKQEYYNTFSQFTKK